MQIFRGDERQLKDVFGLSSISTMWVGVLRSRQIYLSEPVLELCKPGGIFEALLHDRSLTGCMDDLGKLRELQRKHDPELQFPLTILDAGREKVLALADEILAEEGWQQQPLVEQRASPLAPEIHLEGLEYLFATEELAQLKMTIATAVEASQKIEAIRKMALSQVETKEKALLFLHALGDSNLQVRSEAAQALRKTGFNPEIAEAIVSLSSGDENRRRHAIGSLGKLFCEGSDIEKGAVLQIFLTTLRDESYQNYSAALIEVLTTMMPYLPANPAMFERILASALENLVSRFDELYERVAILFRTLMQANENLVGNFLWAEVSKSQLRRLRAFLLWLLSERQQGGERYRQIAAAIVEEIGYGEELDPVYMRLMGALTKLGKDAIAPILTRFRSSIRVGEKIQLVQLLDNAIKQSILENATKDSILHAFVEIFPSAHNSLRLAIMESSLLVDAEVSVKWKTQLAKDMLTEVHYERFDSIHEAVKSCLCRLREAAISPLLAALKKPINTRHSLRAAEILGEVVLELAPEAVVERQKVKDFCYKQIKACVPNRGELFKILGKIAYGSGLSGEEAMEIAEYLFAHVAKTSHPYAVLEALGWAGAGNAPAEIKIDICYLFTALLDKRLPEKLSKEKKEEDAIRYEFDFKATAYTDLLPILINGFKRIALSEATLSSLRTTIIDKFLSKWQELATYKIIWSPKNTMDLAEAMQNICMHPLVATETKVKLAAALYQKVDIFSITELLTIIFQHHSEADDIAAIAQCVCDKLIEFACSEDYNNPEDKEIVFRCIGRMVSAKRLAVKKTPSSQYRERLLHVLFSGQREQIFGVEDTLRQLLSSVNVPKNLKKEIDKRLPRESDLPQCVG